MLDEFEFANGLVAYKQNTISKQRGKGFFVIDGIFITFYLCK